MIKKIEFVRNIHVGDLLEIFLVSSVTSLLIVRFFIAWAGYPQLSTNTFHIAHMLWGGLIMMSAVVLLLAFLGNRVLQAGAIIGGIGFGIFIDELGKFITQDNNYLFQPTVALIYIIFLILFFVFRYIDQHSKLSRKEYLMNALRILEEAVLKDMDKEEKRHFSYLLNRADQTDEVTIQLKKLLGEIEIIQAIPGRFSKIYRYFSKLYKKATESRFFIKAIIIFFILKTLSDILTVSIFLITYFSEPSKLFLAIPSPLIIVTWGQIISTTIAAIFVLTGAVTLKFSRNQAYFFFKQSLLVSIFLTQFFMFYREQFSALTGLVVNVILLIGIEYVILEERNMKLREKPD